VIILAVDRGIMAAVLSGIALLSVERFTAIQNDLRIIHANIPAHRNAAVQPASISIVHIAIITLFSKAGLRNTVSAVLNLTRRNGNIPRRERESAAGASVPSPDISVIALLTRLNLPIPAFFFAHAPLGARARPLAANTALIAHLPRIEPTVTTEIPKTERAPIARDDISIIAFLIAIHHAIAAIREHAVWTAIICTGAVTPTLVTLFR
jgi:hypothetical protein